MVVIIRITIILEITASGLAVTSCQIYIAREAEGGWIKKNKIKRGQVRGSTVAQCGAGPEADPGNGMLGQGRAGPVNKQERDLGEYQR